MQRIELKLASFKYLIVIIGVLTGFLQPGIFTRVYEEKQLVFLLLIYGYSTYLAFFDFGVGKPAYAILREKFINKSPINSLINRFVSFYVVVTLIMAVGFTTLILTLGHFYDPGFNYGTLAIFSLSIILGVTHGYMQNILNAIDDYIFFQKVELVKKSTALVSIFFVLYDGSFLTTAIILLISSCFCLTTSIIRMVKKDFLKISINPNVIFSGFFKTIYRYFYVCRDYLVFSISETVFYNCFLIITPLLFLPNDVVVYSLWMKVFLGFSLIVRVISDTRIHRINRIYYSGEREGTYKLFNKTIVMSIIAFLIMYAIYILVENFFFLIWVEGDYVMSNYMNAALFIWGVSNLLQHASGTFLLSLGDQFVFMRKLSLKLVTCYLLSILIMSKFGLDFEAVFLLASFVYFLGSLTYYHRVVKITRGIIC